MIDLSLNEAETLAARAARGAGFSWGLADEIGRAARTMVTEGEAWSQALLALAQAAGAFEPPDRERIARWRRRERDFAGSRPLCPVRTAALLLDDPPDLGATALEIANVGLPIWLDAMLKPSDIRMARMREPLAANADIVIRRGPRAARPMVGRRAVIVEQTLAALSAYAARTYVPESERSRARGAGGGSVDDE